MRIEVRLFARARDLAGSATISLELPQQATVGDLRTALLRDRPALKPLAPHLFVAVGTDYAPDSLVLAPGAEVACFPPVSGG